MLDSGKRIGSLLGRRMVSLNSQEVVVCVDIATSGIKVVVYDESARVVALCKESYGIRSPEPGFAEQNPDEIVGAFFASLKSAILSLPSGCRVAAISLGGVMHSILGLDGHDRPITPVMIWADTRSQSQAKSVKQHHGIDLYQTIGVPIHAMLPLTKIRWLKDTEPSVFRSVSRFVSIKEYLLWHMTGQFVVDVSTAAASGLFHLGRRSWSDESLAIAGITGDMLSAPTACTEALPLSHSAWCLLGASEALKEAVVVVGSTDGVLANLGSGAVEINQVGVTLGSSGAVRRMTNRMVLDDEGRTFCYPLDESNFVVGGATNTGGVVWDWMMEQFPPDESDPARLWEAIDEVPAGADGLLFIPYLAGERAPVWDDSAQGVLFGLTLGHRRPHIWRAAAESMAYSLVSIYRLLQGFGPMPSGVIATGGFFRQPIWTRLLSDALGVPVFVCEDEESSARGSFLLAKSALMKAPLRDVLKRYPAKLKEPVVPADGKAEVYDKHLARFARLYEAVQPLFREGVDERKR